MVVLNSRRDALALLDRLQGEPVLHLSTLLCGANRRDVLLEVRRALDYPEVAEKFRLIEDNTVSVIVEYEERDPRREQSRRWLVERIRREEALRPGDHRRLQPYVVGLLARDFEASRWAMREIAEGVWLWTGEYDPVRGIIDVRDDPADVLW